MPGAGARRQTGFAVEYIAQHEHHMTQVRSPAQVPLRLMQSLPPQKNAALRPWTQRSNGRSPAAVVEQRTPAVRPISSPPKRPASLGPRNANDQCRPRYPEAYQAVSELPCPWVKRRIDIRSLQSQRYSCRLRVQLIRFSGRRDRRHLYFVSHGSSAVNKR
jgi:hypothetical protein